MAEKRKKHKKNIFSSLHVKAICAVIVGIAIAAGVYVACVSAGSGYVKNVYMTRQKQSQRLENSKYEFKKYVRENLVSSKDTDAVAQWTKDERYVSVFVYDNERLKLEAGYWSSDRYANNYHSGIVYEGTSDSEEDGTYFNVKFADGVYKVRIYEYSEQAVYDTVRIVAIVAACIVFAVGLSIYTNRITRGIVRLSHAAENMGSGDLATAITFNGSDELAQLAGEMDRMRVSVVRQMENERVAMQANKDLITAISHDIRTPLTTMLGYLDLLTDGQYASEEEKDKYIGIVRNKSMELKSLTDRLFRYFLAFGEKDIEPEMDAYDAGILMEQMVAERLLELKDLGWKVESAVDIAEGGVICVDVEFLKRVVDNVISNIKKHADPDGRIFAWIHEEDGKLSIYVANGIPKVPRKAESTKIGLKICTKLMEQMGGEFHTYAEENRFAAEIVIPIIHTEG